MRKFDPFLVRNKWLFQTSIIMAVSYYCIVYSNGLSSGLIFGLWFVVNLGDAPCINWYII